MSNITLNTGSGGATLGTDTVTGTPNVDYQIVKIGYSASGTTPTQVSASAPLPIANYFGTTAASVNSGNLDAGTLRVVLATNSPSLANASPVTQSGSWTVNLGTLNGVALDSSVNGLLIAQGAALGTNKGPLLQGSVTTAPPAYTTGNINPLSLTTGGALRVDASAATVPVSGTFWQATQPVSGTVSITANSAVNVAQVNGVTPLMGNGTTGTGSPRVTIASDNSAFSVNAIQSGTWTVQPGNTANTTPWLVTDTPAASGGLSSSTIVSAASNNLTQIKSSAGQLYFAHGGNLNASPRYVKVFFKPSASVTMGTTAADTQFMIPGNTAGAGFVINIDKGVGGGGTGLTIAITGGISLTDNTSISANEVCLTVGYK